MDIILIRHGKKEPHSPDNEAPLAPKGLTQVDHLEDQLAHLKLRPEIYLTSKYKRAKQTAERLSYNPDVVYPIDALTPDNNTPTDPDPSSEQIFETIIDEAKGEGIELGQQTIVAIVGHEPKLGQILASLTSTPVQPVKMGKGIWVRAASLADFLHGKGKIQTWIN